MSERLSDEQVARLRSGYAAYGCFIVDAAKVDAALADLQAWRALLNGGPCPTCGGRRCQKAMWGGTGAPAGLCGVPAYGPAGPNANAFWLSHACPRHGGPPVCPNPDCIDGRVPGVIERLEAILDQQRTSHLAAVIADLQHAGGDSAAT